MTWINSIRKTREFNAIGNENAMGWRRSIGEGDDIRMKMYFVGYEREIRGRWVGYKSYL